MSQRRFASKAAIVSVAMGGSLIALAGTAFATTSSTSSFAIQAPPESGGVVQVSTPGELIYVDQHQNDFLQAHIELTTSINLETNGTPYEWTPLGTGVFAPPPPPTTPLPSGPPPLPFFSGIFDGEGHSISGWEVNSGQNEGFFGVLTGTVENLGVNATVTGSGPVMGELVGSLQGNGTIENSYSAGTVTSSSTSGSTGGLVGFSFSNTNIQRSYSSAAVSSSGVAGVIGGLIGQSGGDISNCYATGAVAGGTAAFVGGIVGWQTNGSITDVYATGHLSGGQVTFHSASFGGLDAGGVVGNEPISGQTKLADSFSDENTTGQTKTVGNSPELSPNPALSGELGATAEPTSKMKDQQTFTNAGWDFTNTWGINSNINNGYPYLQVFYPNGVQGQLPEVPFAGAFPFIGLAGAGAFLFARRRKNANRFAN